MKTVAIASACIACLCCGHAAGNGTPAAQGHDPFADGLFNRWCAGNENRVFSPYSLTAALGMTASGARGETARQLAATLGLGADAAALAEAFAALQRPIEAAAADGAFILRTANALFPQREYPFRAEFLEIVRTRFGGETRPLDYVGATEAARGTINGWVSERTAKRIPELIPPGILSPDTRLALVNAVYFKGDWLRPFIPARTRSQPFIPADGTPVQTPFMNQTGSFPYAETADAQVLELPYAGGRLALTILLPKPGKPLALAAAPLFNRPGGLDFRTVEVAVAIPKFTFSSFYNANETLQALGIRDAFAPGRADFSGMDGTRSLFLSSVLHQAFIEVNETGTEAAAATAAIFSRTSLPQPPEVTFIANRPFAFAIREPASGVILFLGTLANPK